MSASGVLQKFTLSLARTGAQAKSRLARSGPDNVLQIAKGKDCREAIRLAGMVFPICPNAHMAAGLYAIEDAGDIHLPVTQAAAREAVILAEAITGSVWRASLTWPRLLGVPETPDPVRGARSASQRLSSAIFVDDWTKIGGASIHFDASAAGEALETLRACLKGLPEVAEKSARAADTICAGIVFEKLRPLGGQITSPQSDPIHLSFEETPLSLHCPDKRSATLGDWFRAHAVHAEALICQLQQRLSEIGNQKPVPCPGEISGRGFGLATTSRGRLRHAIDIEEDRIIAWHTAAPTDWNFAPDGPLARYCARLDPERLAEQAAWLVAALDPCAPCTVALSEARADA